MKGKAHWRSEYAGGTKREDEKRETGKQHARWFATTVRCPNYITRDGEAKSERATPSPYTLYPVSHPSIRSSAEAVYQKRGSFAACVKTRHTHTHTGIVARGCREIGTKKESRCIQETLVCVCSSYLSCSFSPCLLPASFRVHAQQTSRYTVATWRKKREKCPCSTLFLYKRDGASIISIFYYRSGPTKYFSRGIAMGRNVVAKINEKLD